MSWFLSYQMVLLAIPWSNGRDSVQKSMFFLNPTWQYLWKSSKLTNRAEWPDSDLEMNRIASSKSDSSHGMANGPWLVKPYSSSAWTRSFLKTGWFRYVARTTNLLQLVPTQTATYPAGTSDGMRAADMRALLRHLLSICLSLTMWRILLHFPNPTDIFPEKKVRENRTSLVWLCGFSQDSWLALMIAKRKWKILGDRSRGRERVYKEGGLRKRPHFLGIITILCLLLIKTCCFVFAFGFGQVVD